jgi:hypothetical protein
MRSALFPALLCLTLPSASAAAQAAQNTGIRCTIQARSALTDADRAFVAGAFARAESLYSAQLSGSAAAAGYAGVVRSQLVQNKLAEALTTAQRASGNIPEAAAQALLGDVLLRSGKVDDASVAYNKAVKADPCWARGQFGLGRLSNLTSHHATAARKFAAAHTLSPGDAEIAAAFLATQPADLRATGLHALLAAHPVLSPEAVERLTGDLAILDQHKTCTVSEPFTTANLPLDAIMFNGKYERSWGLKVRVNDSDTPLLELDTTASGIVLSQRDAQRAGVKPLRAGPASLSAPYLAYADRLKIGNLEYHDCPVRVVPASALGNSNSLIGTDFFRDHLIHIDYVARLLTLNSFPSAPGLVQPTQVALTDPYISEAEKSWTPVLILSGNLIIPTMVNKQGPFSFLIDTGVGRTILSPPVESSVLGGGPDRNLNLTGTSGIFVKVLPRDGGGDILDTDVRGPDGALLKVSRPGKIPSTASPSGS